jgi:hypothetical protein
MTASPSLDRFQVSPGSEESKLRIERKTTMTKQMTQNNLSRVKQALSDKYRSLAGVAKSNVKQRLFLQKAKTYQAQALKLAK